MAKSKRVLSEADIDYLQKIFSEAFMTKDEFKEYRSEALGKIDKVLSELVKVRQNQEILTPVTYDMRERLDKVEKVVNINQPAS